MASGGILTTVGPSLIVWKVGPLLLNQINTLCTHTHTQTIYTDSTLRLQQQQQPCVKDISFQEGTNNWNSTSNDLVLLRDSLILFSQGH